MKKVALFIFISVAAAALSGCSMLRTLEQAVEGSGEKVRESRTAQAFSGIELNGSPDIQFRTSSTPKIWVTCDKNLLPYLSTKVKNGILVVEFTKSVSTKIQTVVEIEGPNLKSLKVSGSGNVDASGLAGKELTVSVSGSGNVKVIGNADDVTASITGSGTINGKSLNSSKATISVTGSGDVSLRTRKATASITGSGNIDLYGNPSVTKNILGSGSVSVHD